MEENKKNQIERDIKVEGAENKVAKESCDCENEDRQAREQRSRRS